MRLRSTMGRNGLNEALGGHKSGIYEITSDLMMKSSARGIKMAQRWGSDLKGEIGGLEAVQGSKCSHLCNFGKGSSRIQRFFSIGRGRCR